MSTFTFSIRRRDLAWATALIVLLSAIWVAKSDVADAGGSPPGDGIAVVYVAVSTNYPDSLGVGPGAGGNAAPIIIVPTNPPIPPASEAELIRLDPRTVIIVGGTAVISAAMETALGALLPNAAVTRIGGANRYETNAMFSAATFPIEGWASIPAVAFTADQPATDTAVISTYAYNTSDGFLRAPIQLPHGAEILELKADVWDVDGNDVVVHLHRVDNTANLAEAAAGGTSSFSGGSATVSDTTITAGTEIVDNENYAYLVYVSGIAPNNFVVKVMVHYRLGVSTG